ncbi:DUF6541 family protein [Sinomonas albida]|uniref:DUF6541 family protein n=1 Tax=Sinomonas albida TaxID=369942 RepID=UPI0010A7D00C|nr:DUF6541 family protein [Sinomonas albida]
MTWISATPALLTAALVLVLPGAVFGWSLRLRGVELYALAPLLSASIVAVGAILCGAVHITWNPLALAASTALVSAIGLLVTRPGEKPVFTSYSDSLRRAAPAALGLLVGAALLGSAMMRVFGAPDHISQTTDNIFHLNAIRYIMDTGSASSLTVGQMTGISFYPAVWHAFGALIVQLSGASIPVAASSLTIAIAAIVWPSGVLYLARQALPDSRIASLAAGIVAAGYPAHPILLAMWGVLYPNQYSISLLPAMLALVVRGFGLGAERDRLGRVFVLLGLGAPGLALAHPGAAMALVAFAWPLVVMAAPAFRRWLLARGWRAGLSTSVVVTGLALLAAATIYVWNALRPDPELAQGPPLQTMAQALGQIFLGAPMGASVGGMVTVAFVVGCVAIARGYVRPWPIGAFAAAAFLFVAVSSFDRVPFREFFTGVWYNDAFRLAAQLPVVMAPIALVGLDVMIPWLSGLVDRAAAKTRAMPGLRLLAVMPAGRRASAVTLIVLVLVAADGQIGNIRQAVWDAQPRYFLNSQSELLSSDERQVLERLDQHVPASDVIAGNPWTGTAFAYAYAGRRTLELHVYTNASDDVRLIDSSLRSARTMPAVCDAVRRLGVRYVLDFGLNEFHGYHHDYAGLYHLDEDGLAKVIDRQGDAKLLQLTVCGL